MMQGYCICKLLRLTKTDIRLQDLDTGETYDLPLAVKYKGLREGATIVLKDDVVLPPGSKSNNVLRRYRIRQKFLRIIKGSPRATQYLGRLSTHAQSQVYAQILDQQDDPLVIKRLQFTGTKSFKAVVTTKILTNFRPVLCKLTELLQPHGYDARYYVDDKLIITGQYNQYLVRPYKHLASLLKPISDYIIELTVS